MQSRPEGEGSLNAAMLQFRDPSPSARLRMTRDFFTPSQDDGWRRLHNSQLPPANRRLRAISHVELGEDVGHVILHRSLGEIEAVRDFFVRGAVAEEGEDLALAAGERDDERFRSRA